MTQIGEFEREYEVLPLTLPEPLQTPAPKEPQFVPEEEPALTPEK